MRSTLNHGLRSELYASFQDSANHLSGAHQLFDLRTDPGERRDLAAARPPEYARLLRLLQDWRREVDRADGQRRPERSLSEEHKKHQHLFKQLRSLGYIE